MFSHQILSDWFSPASGITSGSRGANWLPRLCCADCVNSGSGSKVVLFLLLFNVVGVSFRLLLVVGCIVHVFSDDVSGIIGRVGECMGIVVSVSGNRIMIGAR